MKADLIDLRIEAWLRNRNSGELKLNTNKGQIPVKDLTDTQLAKAIEILEDREEQEEMLRTAMESAPNYLFY